MATSSRPKALAAWEVEQDLFKSGLAREIEDGPEREAALASPGTVIKTGVAINAGQIEAVKAKPDAIQAKRRKAKARVSELRAKLEALEAEALERIDTLKAERAALDERIAGVQTETDKATTRLRRALAAAKARS